MGEDEFNVDLFLKGVKESQVHNILHVISSHFMTVGSVSVNIEHAPDKLMDIDKDY